jgi:glucose/arabinose dehydrogenase
MLSSNSYQRQASPLLICGLILIAMATDVTAQPDSLPLVVPTGFRVQLFAQDLGAPRGMAFGPDGHLYVTDARGGRVLRTLDIDADGRADSISVVLENLNRPSGIAWQAGDLWVAEEARVIRLDGLLPAGPVSAGLPQAALRADYAVVVDSLPTGGFWTRTLLFELGGEGFFVGIGSSCNLCQEEDRRRAAIVRYDLDGGGERVWASGLRDAVGLAFHPETGELWATSAGRDWLGDDLPPDELNAVRRGRNYGWPYCYGARVPNPEYADQSRCDPTQPPIATFPAHSSPLGLAFYTGDAFPPEYQNDAFVALHGSWNRSAPAGYKVVRVRVEAGHPIGVEDFVTGWLSGGGDLRGRPVQPLMGPDGALYVSDDYGGRIWRVVHEAGEQAAAQ